MIGDTDFFIDLMHPRRDHHARALSRARDLENRGNQVAMTAVTRFELSVGIERFVEPAQERDRVLRLVRAYPTYPLDGAAADRAGSIHGSLAERGSPIGALDAMIAAVALERGEPLLTRNAREFARVQGLTFETY